MVLILNRSDIEGLVEMSEVIEAVEAAHIEHARGMAAQPHCPSLAVAGSNAIMLPMLAASSASRLGGVKLLVDCPGNHARDLPVQQSTLMLVNMDDGRCEAVMHGGSVTLCRTAAASAVATRALAREDSHVLGLIGAGKQARAHLEAISMVRDIRKVLVWSRTTSTAERFATHARNQGFEVVRCEHPREVVRGCDILCTLTPSKDPIVEGAWFTEGLHINAVGAPPRKDHREIDTLGVQRARLIVDDLAVAFAESGEIVIPLAAGAITRDDVCTELGAVLLGTKSGRVDSSDITLFDSVGVAIQDIATAKLSLDKARSAGAGMEISLA